MASSGQRVVLGCLTGLAIALLLVGAVSGTFLRHIVQILPIIAASGVLARPPDWEAYAAFSIFPFWIFIVVLIWLFLLGLSRVANGHYTAIEVVSTFFMAGSRLRGREEYSARKAAAARRARSRDHLVRRAAGCGHVGQLLEANRESMS